ncbi:class I SAM-dependent methyltransferase [Thermodesulfovibrionales bacterium]|nr:class I SAM-dependent methyltransferase [Thermodesulfovibrionales bacterium]
MKTFGKDYAQYYDAFYHDKNYAAECDFLEKIFNKYSPQKIKSVIDLGCGTGGHAIELAKRGYKVVGVDISSGMINAAKNKSLNIDNIDIQFHVSKVEEVALSEKFDAAICMFNAINYVTSDEGLEKTLSGIHKHLRKNGLFIFDFRNGITSLRSYSPVRTKWVNHEDRRILRISKTELDAMEHLYHTTYTCLTIKDSRIIQEFKDEHTLRYMFPREVKHFLKKKMFKINCMCPFLKLDEAATENDWNITVISTAIN